MLKIINEMVEATQSEIQKLDLLYSQEISAGQAAAKVARIGQEAAAGIALLKNEVAEIKYIEIETPLDAAGAAEALEQIRLIIDGKEWEGDLVQIRADNDSLVAVPRGNSTGELETGKEGSRKIFSLGNTLPELVRMGVNDRPWLILTNTTPKVREAGKIDVEFTVGNTATTDNFRVRMYGVKYTNLRVAQFYMRQVYGTAKLVSLSDAKTGRQFTTSIRPEKLDAKDWTGLIGGNEMNLAGKVEVRPLLRWARNDTATVLSKKYNLSFKDNQVTNPENNMDFEVEDDELYLITHLGLIPSVNHKLTRIEANGREVFKETIEDNKNTQEFGRFTGIGPGVEPSDHLYRPLPSIDTVYGNNETLVVSIEDDGSTVIADGTNFGAGSLVVIAGYFIKDPSFKNPGVNMFGPRSQGAV